MNDTRLDQSVQKTVTPVTVLVLGIVAAALSYTGYSIAGIIVGCIAAKKVKVYLEENGGITCNMVMYGSILSKVGIYLGIGLTIFYSVYVVCFYFLYFGLIFSIITEEFMNTFLVLLF